jgi:hypothetical protein
MDSPTGKVVDSEASYEIDKAAEARLVRKLDFRLLPLLALAYMLCYFDVSSVLSPLRPPYEHFASTPSEPLADLGSLSFLPPLAFKRRKRSCRWFNCRPRVLGV